MRRLVLAIVAALAGCGDTAPRPAGGANLTTGRCGRGFVVVHSDYASTSVSILHADGAVAQPHFISSAGATTGLSAPLSGDVVVPSARIAGEEVVLVDRRPAVVTWVTLATGAVRAQLDVGTGFAANPQDYLSLDDGAYVSRYDENPDPGREPFDGGSDLLRIDPAVPAVVKRIDLAAAVADAPGFLPRPNRMARIGNRVIVVLSAYDPSFAESAPSRLAVVDPATDAVIATRVLDGLHGCAAIAVQAQRVAVSCTGRFGGDSDADPTTSGVALFEVEEGGAVAEIARWGAAALGRPAGFGLAFDEQGAIWATTLGTNLDVQADDRLLRIDPEGSVAEIWRAEAFALGEVRCATPVAGAPDEGACGGCFVTDAQAAAVQRFEAGSVAPIFVEDGIGLPPRYLGRL